MNQLNIFGKIIYIISTTFCLAFSANAKLNWDSKTKELFPSLLDKEVVANFAFENVEEDAGDYHFSRAKLRLHDS